MAYERVDLTKYVVISAWYGCNNNCSICMLSSVKDSIPPIGLEQYRTMLVNIARDRRYRNLILSGAEITTFEGLVDYVRDAASLNYFGKIQIQTNGRRIADRAYAEALVEAGVGEFFISIHGMERTHDAITCVPGSFAQVMEGLENLNDLPVNVITNTVLNTTNYPEVSALLGLLSGLTVSEMHMWNYYPMERTDTKGLVVSMEDFSRLLPGVLDTIRPSGKPLVLKSFPECLPIREPGFFDSGYPATLIPELFWKKFGENRFGTCVYKEECSNKPCWGLSGAYIEKYGDERGRLTPFP